MKRDGGSAALRVVYAAALVVIALGGLVTIVDWARQGDDLPGGAVPVTGRVLVEEPGFGGSLAMVEVAYEAGGKERTARLPVPGSADHPNEPTYLPGEAIALTVSRTNPDRVRHANWQPAAPARIPGGLVALVAAVVVTPLVLPGPRRRLQAAVDGALRNGGGRGI